MLKSTNQGVNSQLNSGNSFLTEVDNQLDVYSDQIKNEVTNDFIPDELLFALKQMDSSSNKPPVVNEKGESLKEVLKKGPPASLWHHKSRRKNFKHLTNNPRSNGDRVGTRDVSFLFDRKPLGFNSKTNQAEGSGDKEPFSKLKVPGKVAENEFNLVKSKKVRSLKFLDSKNTTELLDVEKKLRVFPSLQPAKRHEVVQLLKSFDYMLKKSGVDDESVEVNGPSQIHHLLELVKKEQKIYDLAFSEVIRQVSVGCIERGQLLSKLRTRYADLLSRVPRQVKSLHTEVLAQRALDRRLTEQLEIFKTSIHTLTSELSQMKQKDEVVTAETEHVKNELELAMTDSKENAKLVEEYHSLYELQRKRLENNINNLNDEKDLWAKSALSLSKKIMNANELVTSKKLNLAEKGWYNVVRDLNMQLSDADQQNIEDVQFYVQNWKGMINEFGSLVEENDKRTENYLDQMSVEADTWLKKLKESYMKKVEEDVEIATTQLTNELAQLYKSWDNTLDTALERYDSDYSFEQAEKFDDMNEKLKNLADVALRIFRRHKTGEGEIHELGPQMNNILNRIKILEHQLNGRVLGDHGVVEDIRTMKKQVSMWNTKLTTSQTRNLELQHAQLLQIFHQMEEVSKLTKQSSYKLKQQNVKVTKTGDFSEELEFMQIEDVVSEISDWSREVASSIEASNAKLQSESSRIHGKMTQWMIESILYLAPDAEEEEDKRKDTFTLQLSQDGLQSKAEVITKEIAEFTSYLSECVEDVVAEKKHENDQLGISDRIWQEYANFKNEARDWITTAEMVLKKVSGHDVKLLDEEVEKKLIPPKIKNLPRDKTGIRPNNAKSTKKERDSKENSRKSTNKMKQLAKIQKKLQELRNSRKSQEFDYTEDKFKKAKKRFDSLRKKIQPDKEDKMKIAKIVKDMLITAKDPKNIKINELDPELFSILNTNEIDKIIEENKTEILKNRITTEETKEETEVKLRKNIEEDEHLKQSKTEEKPIDKTTAVNNGALVKEVSSEDEVESSQHTILPEQSQITDASTLKIDDNPNELFGRFKNVEKIKLNFSENVHSQTLPSVHTSSLSSDKLTVSNLAEDSQMEFYSNLNIKMPKKTKKIEKEHVEGETFVELIAGGTKKAVLDTDAIKRLSETRDDMRMIQEKFLRKKIEQHDNQDKDDNEEDYDEGVKVSEISIASEKKDHEVSDEILVPYQDNAGDARLSQQNVNFLSNVEVNGIGEDANVMRHILNDASFDELVPPCSKLTQKALDAIANVDKLQQELIETEIRAQQAEDFAISLQEEIVNKDQKIIKLEKIIEDLKGLQVSESLEEIPEVSVYQSESTTAAQSSSLDPHNESRSSSREKSERGKRKTASPKKKSRSKK